MSDITEQVHQVFESYGLTITAAQASAIADVLLAIALRGPRLIPQGMPTMIVEQRV